MPRSACVPGKHKIPGQTDKFYYDLDVRRIIEQNFLSQLQGCIVSFGGADERTAQAVELICLMKTKGINSITSDCALYTE